MLKKIIKLIVETKTVNNSIINGSITAIAQDFYLLLFNFRSLFLHLKNYLLLLNRKEKDFFLHLGCGNDYKNGFINLDMNKVADYYFDARNKLPFKNFTVKYIYSSHFIEHLTNKELMSHFKECYRVLAPNGIYRICAPDFVGSIKAYLKTDQKRLNLIRNLRPLNYKYIDKKFLTYGDYLDCDLHEDGAHKIFFDFKKVKNMLIYSGFKKKNINLSAFDPSVDLKKRKGFSIYIQAKKNSDEKK